MSYEFYKNVHLIGVMLLFLSLGGALVFSAGNVDRGHPWRKLLGASHGLSLLLLLVAGFGLLAKLAILTPLQGWVYAKLAIWLVLGGSIAMIRRRPQWAGTLWLAVVILGGLAAYLGINKPF